MIKDVVTRNSLYLLNPSVLVKAVEMIEKDHPGWWWSLSQKKNRISLSMGPGRNGPREKDLKLALTKEGDTGFHYGIYFCSHQMEEDFLIWLNTVFLSIAPLRTKASFACPHPTQELAARQPWYRHQDSNKLKYLSDQYENLLSDVAFIESKDYRFTEVYIGACDTSSDCSLRGTRHDGSDFDITVDVSDKDTGIDHSVYWSLIELKDDILTTVK